MGELRYLEDLDLIFNFIRWYLAKRNSIIEKLKSLNISNDKFEDLLYTEIEFLNELEEIDLGRNVFSGTMPTEIRICEKVFFLIFNTNRFWGNSMF